MLARWEQVFDLTVLGELGWVYWVPSKTTVTQFNH